MAKKIKIGRIEITGNEPMKLIEDANAKPPPQTELQKKIFKQVSSTIKAYMKAAKELLENKYVNTKHLAPSHLSNPSRVLIIACPDGIFIRFELNDEKKMYTAWSPELLAE